MEGHGENLSGAESAAKSWPSNFPDPKDAIRRRFEPRKLRMDPQDRDAPMMIMIVLGMMNPLVIIAVTVVIAAEKILPLPAVVARLVGISAIIAGVVPICVLFLRSG